MKPSVIKIEDVGKLYKLGYVGTGSFREDVIGWWAQLRGKPNPNIPIGAERTDSNLGYLWALRDINLEIEQGEILGIIGANGAGKSTLLKLLSRVTAPTVGRIKMKGRVGSLLEVGTGFHPELTGRENVYLNGSILGMPKHEIDRKFDEIVDFAGVETYIDTPVKRFSSGMYVRLGFAVAAHLDPDILIVDEVLAVGDADFQQKAVGRMNEISTEVGKTILFVSHNMASVSKLCRKCIWIDDGSIIMNGPTDEVIEAYISKNSMDQSYAEFEIDDRKEAQILSVEILSSDSNHTYFVNKPIKYKISYLLKEMTINYRVGIQLERPDGTAILTSISSDFDGELMENPTGTYTVEVEIPGYLLAAGKYLLSVFIGQPRKKTLDIRKNALSFNIDKGSLSSGISESGAIAKAFEWNQYKNE